MSYNKHTWVNNVDAVDEDKMNHIENGIANAVEKTGDTMTGELLFENKDTYSAIRKTRTFNNKDYQVSVGVGGNVCARIEFIEVPDNVLNSVEIRSNGIYNGITGNKLIESKNEIAYQNWNSVVLTRSDSASLYIMLYGSNILKEGTYSIDIEGGNSFELRAYGSTNGNLIIPKTALNSISRKDWGFELIFNRSAISGMSGEYNGVGIIHEHTLKLKST